RVAAAVAAPVDRRDLHALVRLAGAPFRGALSPGGVWHLRLRGGPADRHAEYHGAPDVLAHWADDPGGRPATVHRCDVCVLRPVSVGARLGAAERVVVSGVRDLRVARDRRAGAEGPDYVV